MTRTIFDEGSVEVLAEALRILRDTEELMEVNPDRAGAGAPTPVNVAQYSLAMISEVDEYAKELQWKPWKLPRPVDAGRVVDEFADILAFLGILFGYGVQAANKTPEQFAMGFLHKSHVNIQRINEGTVQGYGGHKFHPDKLVEPGPGSVYREALNLTDD